MRLMRIPKERVGALIGTDGETKDLIERRAGVKLQIDTEGEVNIEENPQDPLAALKTMDLVKAIGRGFSPQRAIRLLDDDEYLEIIELGDFIGKKSDQLSRVRSRLIGTNGKTRRIIEDLTGAHMSIYGSTVSLIGNSVQLPVAKTAVEMILRGSEHATVYRYLERSRATLRIAEMGFDV
ncbi:KH domain-containing protein [Methanomassiliicoccus luminyensis]|uniref:KH domain-containing protein n=1 Tax=Methanomassiliicoccus luminyensis TaxID=1080712 RepID=UPI000474AC0F|nr:KH domain-containing protein [Methanomassiliicoccus luminyensis]